MCSSVTHSCLEDTTRGRKTGFAMANADHVIFASHKEQEAWSMYGHGHFATFRPFTRSAASLDMQGREELKETTRNEIRSRYGVDQSCFMVTVLGGGSTHVGALVEPLKRKFASWLLVIIEGPMMQLPNVVSVGREDIDLHLLAADLHVWASGF